MKIKLFSAFLFICNFSFAQMRSGIAIIPEPVSIRTGNGQFVFPQNLVIEASSQPELKQVISALRERLTTAAGRKITMSTASPNASIRLQLNKTANATIGNEGYTLSV